MGECVPRLIIGHVTDSSARIWVRGSHGAPAATIAAQGAGTQVVATVRLESWNDYTAVAEVRGLQPGTAYTVNATFMNGAHPVGPDGNPGPPVNGAFSTFPVQPGPLTFMVGSCNLHRLFVDPEPMFTQLSAIAAAERPAFMIHCGDQIYGDIPPVGLSADHWRGCYKDAWGGPQAGRFLGSLPNYMILDDHEIQNNFSNDQSAGVSRTKMLALTAYKEYQHIRNPQDYGVERYFFKFRHADVQFFALDVRTERYKNQPGNRMIGSSQMQEFKSWLLANKLAVKFVATAVPFVGEVQNSGDKWNGPTFLEQRGEILDFIAENAIHGLIFLTGDMHNSYHASLRFSDPTLPVVHELMASPLNQLQKTSIDHYIDPPPVRTTPVKKFTYVSQIRAFYYEHSNVMVVGVNGRNVSFRAFRTKTAGGPVLNGSFTV
jgi:alkaline phosphatase D